MYFFTLHYGRFFDLGGIKSKYEARDMKFFVYVTTLGGQK